MINYPKFDDHNKIIQCLPESGVFLPSIHSINKSRNLTRCPHQPILLVFSIDTQADEKPSTPGPNLESKQKLLNGKLKSLSHTGLHFHWTRIYRSLNEN